VRLVEVPTGGRAVLGAPQVPPAMARRLAELGLRAGEPVEVLHRTAGGGRLLAVGDTRIAIDRQTARSLPVQGADLRGGAPLPALDPDGGGPGAAGRTP
jgi:ferrous iron transport protein A